MAKEHNTPRSFRTLYFPSDCRNVPGVAVGWKCSDAERCVVMTAPLSDATIMIVAHIYPCDFNKRNTVIPSLQRKINELQSTLCNCSSCCNKERQLCPGCVRTITLGELAILGWINPSPMDKIKLLSLDIDSSESGESFESIIVFDPDEIYRKDNSPSHSFFVQVILTRLNHSKQIVTILQHTNVKKLSKALPIKENTRESAETGMDCWWRESLALLSNVSLLCQHLSSNGRQAIPLIRIIQNPSVDTQYTCLHCKASHPLCSCERMFQENIMRADQMIGAVFEIVVGILLGFTIFTVINQSVSRHYLYEMYISQFSELENGLMWLESFPIGFKLNQRLTMKMGEQLRSFLTYYEREVNLGMDVLGAYFSQEVSYASLIVFIFCGGFFGGTTGLAVISDMMRFMTLHVSIIAQMYRVVYRFELCLLSALWRLFQGKKWNILRSRTDTMEYDSMQLLLGTLLFAIVIFLFTTIMVYHVFFGLLDVAFSLTALIPATLIMLFRTFPYGSLFSRLQNNKTFGRRVFLEELDVIGKVVQLSSIYESVSSILWRSLSSTLITMVSYLTDHFVQLIFGRSRRPMSKIID